MAVQAQQYSENLGIGFCGAQEWMESCNGGFDQLYLSLHQQQLQQQQHQQQMMIQNQQRNHNQNLGFDCNQVISNNQQLPSMAFSQSLLAIEKQQRQDIDRLIALQNERLRLALHEQRKQQLAVVLSNLESKAVNLLRQKDEQLIEVTRKTLELQDCLRKAEMENEAWQRVAKENEAMVIALNNTLEQVRENVGCFESAAEDAGSCCEVSNEEEETRNHHDHEQEYQENMSKLVCKGCKSRDSCVLFLPCRHLCSCKFCEAYLVSCPVCKSVKEKSIEVYMS